MKTTVQDKRLMNFVAMNGGVTINGEMCQPDRALSMGRTRFITPRKTTVVLDTRAVNAVIGRRASGWFTKDQAWRIA